MIYGSQYQLPRQIVIKICEYNGSIAPSNLKAYARQGDYIYYLELWHKQNTNKRKNLLTKSFIIAQAVDIYFPWHFYITFAI